MPRILRASTPPSSDLRKDMWKWVRMHASTRPGFARCRLEPLKVASEVASLWGDGQCTKRLIKGTGIMRLELIPWEFQLTDDRIAMVNGSIGHVISHPPEDLDMEHDGMRAFVNAEARAWLRGNTSLQEAEISRFAELSSRYTIGLGVLEHLLLEPLVEDVYIDSPAEGSRVHVTLGDWNGDGSIWKCDTNVIASNDAMMALSSRLRCLSGHPFSEMDPVLETDVPYLSSRVTLVGPPLSPHGLAVAFRRRSSRPWNLASMVRNGTMDASEAALLSILVECRASILICGPRGSGKSSLLSALMMQIPFDQRVLVIEDTLELPVLTMRSSGFDIQSFMAREGSESHGADHEAAIRTSLRMGESALIMGEVRGREARTLYQAMRTGRSGSCVMGTAHGDSAQAVLSRMVHDLDVEAASFAATDVVVTMSLDENSDGRRARRVRAIEAVTETPPVSFTRIFASSINDDGQRSMIERLGDRCGRSPEAIGADLAIRHAFFDEIRGLDENKARVMCSVPWYLHMVKVLMGHPNTHEPRATIRELIDSIARRLPSDV